MAAQAAAQPDVEWEGITTVGTLPSSLPEEDPSAQPDPGSPAAMQAAIIANTRALVQVNITLERVALAMEAAAARPALTSPLPPLQPAAVPWALPVTGASGTAIGTVSGGYTTPGADPGQAPQWLCPVHGTPPKFVPAGNRKSDGRAYAAFWACSTPQCRERVR